MEAKQIRARWRSTLLTFLVSCSVWTTVDGQQTVVIEGATLVDVRTGASRAGVTIVAEHDRISLVGDRAPSEPNPGAQVIDGTAKWVIPGLVDVHVHELSPAYLRRQLAWGVTSILVMPTAPSGSPVEMELASEEPRTITPRLRVSEMFAQVFPENVVPVEFQLIKPQTEAEAREAVRESRRKGYRRIKIIQDDSLLWSGEAHRSPLIPAAVFAALVSEARANDMDVYVHSTQLEVTRTALDAGVDALIHATMDAELSADDWQRMLAANTVWAPTYNALHYYGDKRPYHARMLADPRFGALVTDEERTLWTTRSEAAAPLALATLTHLVENAGDYLETIGRNTRHAVDAGVTVAVGTDGGPAGISTHLEMEFLQEHGLTATEVLTAATYGGAVALRRDEDLGSIEVGKLADMVVLTADPTEDARNCREIEWVIKGGRAHRPRDLALGR